jgi:hypothetical protein
MKRSVRAVFIISITAITLLFTACAPAPYMVATLTQLPFAATPPTSTPYPTVTPRNTRTPTPFSTAVDAAGTESTQTALTDGPALDPTVASALTLAAVPNETAVSTDLAAAEATGTSAPACPPFTFDITVPSPDTPEQFIGKHYDSVNPPTGMKGWTAGLMQDDAYSWAHVNVLNRDMVWIQKLVCRDTRGVAFWEIVDALTLPRMDVQSHEVAVDQCFKGEQQIPYVVAYGTYDPSKPVVPVIKALVGWPVQVKGAWELKEKFIPLGLQDLTCMVQEPQNSH